MKKLIQLKLKILAKIILAKYKPEVIGITGSVGKTSAKEAIYTVLSAKFNVRRNIGNYNNEIGMPLTIIGAQSPGRSVFGWNFVFLNASKLILIKNKKNTKNLFLENGVDRKRDMDYLNSIVKCNIGVITLIGPVHLEFFGSINNIQKEKGKLIKSLKKSGWAILNYDDEKVREMEKMTKNKVLTYGFHEKADVKAQELVFSFEESKEIDNLLGINFKLNYNGAIAPVFLPAVIGYSAIYASLAGASLGITHSMNLVEISEALRKFNSPKGRMNLVKGVKNTLIIDDTYNSSPQSATSALEVASKIPLEEGARRFAVLGDMLELGSFSEEGHREVGRKVFRSKIDKLIVVGERSRDIARGAKRIGMLSDNVFHFANTYNAGKFIQERISQGDLILIKGSQGMRMEKIVKEIMAEPLRAKELLVRQGEEWKT
ncbi:MAG: UDP-N-acetylmuramoyl-tripeptide--D-alanyl-D-alanine ligase [Candidatus Falkowbacteria bacterium]